LYHVAVMQLGEPRGSQNMIQKSAESIVSGKYGEGSNG